MGVAASAASSPPEPAADPPAKERIRHVAAASSPPEAAAPADPPAKEDIQPAAAADAPPEAAAPAKSPAKEEIHPAAAGDAPVGDAEAEGETVVFDAAAAEAGGEEEVGECPFCLYMKGGGCKDEFVAWEKCMEEAQEKDTDVVEHCAQVTVALRSCMDVHADYYEPILSVERRMSEDLEAAEAEAGQASPASPPALAAEGEQGDNKQAEEEVVVLVEEKQDPAP